VCDGAFFKGEVLAVVGGGDAAVEEADYLTRYASKVYIVHRRHELRASRILQERALANPKIEMVWNKHVTAIVGNDSGVEHLKLEDSNTHAASTLQVGGVFIFIGFKPNTGLVKDHPKHDAAGLILHKLLALDARTTAIWLTHGHLNHVLGVPRLKAETGAPVWLHPADRPLYDRVPEQAQWYGLAAEPLPPPDRAYGAGDTV